jgi:Tol biopolymer transport system component
MIRRRLPAALPLCLALAGALAAPSPAVAAGLLGTLGTAPGQPGLIAFGHPCPLDYAGGNGCEVSRSEQSLELVRPDGSGAREVFVGVGVSEPAFSRDGTWLVFRNGQARPGEINPELDGDIYRVNVDGSGLQQLTGAGDDSYIDTEPEFLSDGRIIFSRRQPWTLPTLFVMNADGSSVEPVTRDVGSASTDGRRIAVSRCRERRGRHRCGIYLYRPNGVLIRRLTRTVRPDANPVFSPNGRLIAFERRAALARESLPLYVDIFLVRSDGRGHAWRFARPYAAEESVADRHDPVWSPDSRRILFREDVQEKYPDESGSYIRFGVKPVEPGGMRFLGPGAESERSGGGWLDPDWQTVR